MRQIVIIGNGISGITCARNIRKKSNDAITIISAESEHFFSRTALMYIYMGHMKYEHTKPYEDFFWSKNKLGLVQDYVKKINVEDKNLLTSSGKKIPYDILIIATGSVTQTFDWPGQNLQGVTGLYNLQDLQNMEAATKNIQQAIIIGGGLIGVEMAEMLHSRYIPVTVLIKDTYYWANNLPEAEAKFIGSHIESNGIKIIYNTKLQQINGDKNNRVESITTEAGAIIACDFAGITTGVKPNISFLKDSTINVKKGVLINKFFETNCKDIYAIGDCAEFENALPGRKTIEQIWYTGRMHGETLAQTICGNKTAYQPGPWFNSAKFFNIEFQTYGLVPSKAEEGYEYFYWQHEHKNIAAGFYYEQKNKTLHGINAYGMRLRHVKFDAWFRENKSIDYVLEHFAQAMFDVEFKKNYLQEIINAFNYKTGAAVQKKKRFAFTN